MMRLTLGFAVGALVLAGGAPVCAQDTQTYTYDVHGRLAAVATARPSSGVLTGYGLDDAGNRTLRQAYGVSFPSPAHEMSYDDTLVTQQMMTSQDGRFTLVLQQDGNLVLYFGATPLWATHTPSGRSFYFRVQGDGNAVLYDINFQAIWATHTLGHPGAVLTLQNDGDLVLRDAAGTSVLWRSNTCCH